MKVLVTGSTGFIGGYVIQELLKHNFDVIATGIEFKEVVKYDWLEHVNYIQANLNENKGDWFSFLGRPDMLIHLAWQGLPNYEELFHFEHNLISNYLFVKNLVDNGIKKVAIIGTCLEYGMQSGALKEDMDTKPDNSYALAKDCLRKFLEQFKKKNDFDLNWIRLFYMYGKGQNPNSLLSQLEIAIERQDKEFNMSGGEQLRDYLPVEKVAEYIVKISVQDKITGIINCCSGKPIRVKKLVEKYLREKNKSIELNMAYYPYPDYEPMAFWGNNSKLKNILRIP